LGPDTLLYRFTMDDPESFERPWTAENPLRRVEAPIFE
jgi:hypothetical protein